MSLLPGNFYLEDLIDTFVPLRRSTKMELVRCDIYEKDGFVHVELDVPGYEKKDINIDVENGVLTIEAKRNEESVQEGKNYYRKERVTGSFKRQFNVGNVNEDDIEAAFKNGVLEVKFPKENRNENKRSIEIK